MGGQAAETLHATVDRIQRQLQAIGATDQIAALRDGDVEAAAREIVELACSVIGCERANVWLFNESETELHCLACYEATPARHSSDMALRAQDFQPEFEALRHSRYVDADDPLTDPRTAGYVEGYLKPLRITSMLDAVVQASGRNLGVLCFEHVDRPHHWEQDEIAFACHLADKLGLALVTRQRLESEARLQFANTLLATQMETSPDGILVVDANARILSMNRRFAEIWSLPADLTRDGADAPVLARVTRSVKHPDAFLERVRYLYAHPDANAHDELETVDGRCIERYTAVLRDPQERYLGRVWFFRDITDRKRAEAEARFAARHDELTGLVNRTVFFEMLDLAIARARRSAVPFAVLYLDLDRFKDVNDTLGHPAGDALLQQAADRIRSCVRGTDVVARFGGDEFAVILSDLHQPEDAARLADVLIDALARPFTIDRNDVRCGASVGIALYGPDTSGADMLLSQADVALYRAKLDGRGSARFFTETMDVEVRTRVALGAELRIAVASDQLFLEYQPQVDLRTQRITGMEALVRWRHPSRGLLPPDVFIPIAEDNGLIHAVGDWVLRESCRQARAWLDAGLPLGRLAVNLSSKQLRAALGLERLVASVLAETGLPPDRLELELTESVLMIVSQERSATLARLRERGVRLAIDDFGTGYSSLDYLRRFPVDRIKLAQDFVGQIVTDPGSAAIVRATIGLARELKIAVIAEGVASEAELALLVSWGCREAQGFFLAPPLNASAAGAMLARSTQPPRRVDPAVVGR